MAIDLKEPTGLNEPSTRGLPQAPWGGLPQRMSLLHITASAQNGGWLAEAFAADSASRVLLDEAVGVTAGLERLRDRAFDAIVVSHEPGALDAVELLEGLRGGGTEEPLLVLGNDREQDLAAICYEVGADAYLCVPMTTTRTLLWTLARAIERHHLIRENRRLQQADRHRLQQEQNEAGRLLGEQRGLIHDLDNLKRAHAVASRAEPGAEPPREATPDAAGQSLALSDSLQSHYRELLRAQVIMGCGNLSKEMRGLAELLADSGITAQQTMELHVQVLEELIRGLGSRSARHVMARADLLVLEVLLYLTEGYRQRYLENLHLNEQA